MLGSEAYNDAASTKGLDKPDDALLSFELSDIGLKELARPEVQSDLLVLLNVVSPDNNGTAYGDDVIAAWNGTGLYKHRVIERKDGLYRVYSSYGYPNMWHYFRVSPDGKRLAKGVWVAMCHAAPGVKEKKNLANVTCTTDVLEHNLNIELTFSGYYISNIGEIQSRLAKLIGSMIAK